MLDAEKTIKLLFAGPVGSGKTAAIRAISDTPPVSSEVPWTDAVAGDKATTTVALDYSTIQLSPGEILHVYGLPGQEYLDFMGAIVGPGALGAVLLLDASSQTLAQDCHTGVEQLARIDPALKFVIGISKSDITPSFSMETMYALARRMSLFVPIFCIDPRDPAQVRQLVRALLYVL
ncbi:MAG TPA: GTPase [Dyella sp.]|uniref:GTP-binding protein n=1 Tax=Dyella sp. TaxID=1869338 RepID=UPI002CD46D53|nr:GTPase [Dyella sp.]HUB90896.1 GTPase [Dyella sp.]